MKLSFKFYNSWPKKSTPPKAGSMPFLWLAIGIFLLFYALPAVARIPNDLLYSWQQEMWKQIGAPKAWDYSIGSEDVVVAVIDTGADVDNPDLRENIWINKSETADNGIDDDNNGYVDDIHGWNFVERNNNVVPPVNNARISREAIYHGTIISGLIGAVGDNKILGAGLNWRVKIMPLRVMNDNGSGSYSNIILAVNYAVNNGANVISISIIGEGFDEKLKQTMRRAYERGVVIVAAAGNNSQNHKGAIETIPLYPTCLDQRDSDNWIVGVTAVNNDDILSDFASCGLCVDLTAPGENIYSTERYAPQVGLKSQFGGPWEGTSFAAPLVTGGAALLKAVRPEWSAKEIIKALLNSADEIDGKNPGLVGQLGYGRLNIGDAVQEAYASRSADAGVVKIYYFSGNKFFVYRPQEQKMIYLANVGKKIIDFASGDINGDGQEEIALLTADGANYHLFILSSKGNQIYDWILKPGRQSGNRLTGNIKIYSKDKFNSALVFSNYDIRTNRTKFYKLNWKSGKLAGELAIDGKVLNWSTKKTDDHLILAEQSANALRLSEYDWAGHRIFELQLPKVDGLESLAVGKLLVGDSEQTVAVINRGKNSEQYVIDLSNRSYTRERLGVSSKNNQSLVLKDMNNDGLLDILRFHLGGGDFVFTAGRGKIIQKIAIPKISGQLAN